MALTPATLKNKLVAAGLALLLAGSSLGLALSAPTQALASETTAIEATDAAANAADATTTATDSADAATDGKLTSTLKLATPELPLANKENQPPAKAEGEGNHTMTFYYCEMVHYDDDPDFSHPTNMRLLYTRTVEGLNVGDELNTWDYVEPINGYFFFDAIPAKPVVVEDESQNGVELRYTNPEVNQYTVNYYRMTDGEDTREASGDEADDSAASDSEEADDVLVDEVGDELVAFEKIKSETVSQQRFNRLVNGDQLAQPLEDLMYVDSYPSSIRVTTDPDKNVINLLYADTMTSLPDDTDVTEDSNTDTDTEEKPNPDAGATTPDATPDNGATTPDTDTDNGSTDDSTDAANTDNATDGNENDADTAVSESDSPATNVTGPRPAADASLPQTGDPLASAMALAGAAALAAAGTLTVARKQH